MKNLIIGLTLVMFLLTIALSATSCNSPGNINSLDNNRMTVTIDGLEKGEEATLTLSLSPGIDPAGKPLSRQTIKSDGERSLTVEITTSLEDGYYQLLLEAPEKYFREPKGYLFQVSQSQIINPVGRPVIFSLLPKEGAPDVEALISLSGPVKQLPRTAPVRGLNSGLLYSDDRVTVRYSTVTGSKKGYTTRKGNGTWEVAVRNTGEYYTITAEAEGYKVHPESYLVLIVGDTAYVVSNNETGEEAIHLDFQFSPENR